MKLTKIINIAILCLSFGVVNAQNVPTRSLDDILKIAKENNAGIKSSSIAIEQASQYGVSAFDLPKTSLYFSKDENNLAENLKPLKVWGIQQDIAFPTVYLQNKKLAKARESFAQAAYKNEVYSLERKVSQAYYAYQIALNKVQIYKELDSLYRDFSKSSERKLKLGEATHLEKAMSFAKKRQVELKLEESEGLLRNLFSGLKTLVQDTSDFSIEKQDIASLKLAFNPNKDKETLGENLWERKQEISKAELSLEKNKFLPDFSFEYFTGTNDGLDRRYNGFQVSVNLPIFFWGQRSKVNIAKFQAQMDTYARQNKEREMESYKTILQNKLSEQNSALEYYENQGNELANELIRIGKKSFQAGEIDYFQYIQTIENAYAIKIEYLNTLDSYNQLVLQLNYLTYNDLEK